jgi:hypothetical protein
MDVVSLFAVVVFGLTWWLHSRTPDHERVVRLFFATLMVLAACVGGLGIVLRLVTPTP